ncbi:MAG: hypothetical protein KIH89_000525 [Candidatus Shapirobacteria bacterium]|nr:hypothetical protein [Candidatus Shapirobacteria bacterium]
MKNGGLSTIQKILIGIFVVSTVWWVTIFARGIKDTTENYLFNVPMAVIPIFASIYSFLQAKKYTQHVDAFRAVTYASLALLVWGLGNIIYLYDNFFLHEETPLSTDTNWWYSILIVVFYGLCSLFWIKALIHILSIIKMKKVFAVSIKKLVTFCALLLLCVGMMYFLTSKSITLPNFPHGFFLGVMYVVFDFVVFFELCMLVYILFFYKSSRYLAKCLSLIIFGFMLNYIADIFYISEIKSIYFVGSWIDFCFLCGVTLQSFGLIQFLTDEKHPRL